jgi:aminoglycoside phosphotransferase (APT) family kinase protein
VTGSGLDPVAIATSLGVPGARARQRIEGGADTLIWRLESETGPVAVRLFRADQHAPAAREREALDAARAAGIPTPAVVAAGAWADRPVTVLEWCPGEPLLDRILATDADLESLGRAFGRTHAAIHRVRPPSSWSARSDSSLLHLDYHPLNVLVEDGRISAVIDWVNTRAGDPRFDIARTYSILVADPTAGAVDRRITTRFRRAWLDGYAEAAGGRPRDLAAFVGRAGELMVRDLAGRNPPRELARIARWADGWSRRTGGERPR